MLAGSTAIEGASGAPIPVISTTNVELMCRLLNEAAPDALPTEVGAKLAIKVALLPGFRFRGNATPPMAKPAPETLVWEIVTKLVPELVSVKL